MEGKHKNIKVKPCSVDWYGMQRQEDGNHFCQNCQKVVHDMSGMTEVEAMAFLEENPGSCGNFFAWQIDALPEEEKTVPKNRFSTRSAAWKKAAAAAAALTLLHGQMPGVLVKNEWKEAEIERLAGDPPLSGPSTNTLLTGVVVDQRGMAIRQPIVLKVYQGNKLIAYPVEVRNGLFSINLAEKARPEDKITLFIPTQTIHRTTISEAKIKTLLGEGQNLVVNVDVEYPPRLGGVMIKPRD